MVDAAAWSWRGAMRSAVRWAIRGAILATILAVLLAYALPQDFRREDPWYLAVAWMSEAVRDFLLHIALGLAAAACVAWAARLRRWAIAALVPAVIVLAPAAWRYVPQDPVFAAGPSLKVMSVNLLWRNTHVEAMAAEVLAEAPDVVLFQEYAPHHHAAFAQRLTAYPHRVTVPRADAYGSAIYSRHAFVGEPPRSLPLGPFGHPQLRAEIEMHGWRLAVYNVHLLGPHYISAIGARRREFADLADRLRAEPLPIVLGGDFNLTVDTPQGHALGALGLRDAHDQAGYGHGGTWPVHKWTRHVPLPGFRIDHVYVSPPLSVTSCRTGVGMGSDHLPLVTTIALPPW